MGAVRFRRLRLRRFFLPSVGFVVGENGGAAADRVTGSGVVVVSGRVVVFVVGVMVVLVVVVGGVVVALLLLWFLPAKIARHAEACSRLEFGSFLFRFGDGVLGALEGAAEVALESEVVAHAGSASLFAVPCDLCLDVQRIFPGLSVLRHFLQFFEVCCQRCIHAYVSWQAHLVLSLYCEFD